MWNNKEEKQDKVNVNEGKVALDKKSGKHQQTYLNKFSGPEIQVLQHLVHRECVNGQITEGRLVKVYEDIFPMGKVGKYVRIVFNMLDHDNNGHIKCGQFIQFISIVARGDDGERACLCFEMFDLRREGVLRKQDFGEVMDSVDELMGCCRSISVKRQFVDEVFGHIDGDNDGVVSKEMFTAFLDRKGNSLEIMPGGPLLFYQPGHLDIN